MGGSLVGGASREGESRGAQLLRASPPPAVRVPAASAVGAVLSALGKEVSAVGKEVSAEEVRLSLARQRVRMCSMSVSAVKRPERPTLRFWISSPSSRSSSAKTINT